MKEMNPYVFTKGKKSGEFILGILFSRFEDKPEVIKNLKIVEVLKIREKLLNI